MYIAVNSFYLSLSPYYLEISALQAKQSKTNNKTKQTPPPTTTFCHYQTWMKYLLCALSYYHSSSWEHWKLTLIVQLPKQSSLAKATKGSFCLSSENVARIDSAQICSWLESPLEKGPTLIAKCDWEDNSRLWSELHWSLKSFNSYILGVVWLPVLKVIRNSGSAILVISESGRVPELSLPVNFDGIFLLPF